VALAALLLLGSAACDEHSAKSEEKRVEKPVEITESKQKIESKQDFPPLRAKEGQGPNEQGLNAGEAVVTDTAFCKGEDRRLVEKNGERRCLSTFGAGSGDVKSCLQLLKTCSGLPAEGTPTIGELPITFCEGFYFNGKGFAHAKGGQILLEEIPSPYRHIPPDTMITEDMVPNRINIETTDKHYIIRLWCG
jgi:hypothetical protein